MTRDPMMSETLAETLHGQMTFATGPVPPLRRLLAGLTAGALALSVVLASAVPVRADDNDDLVAALAALALLGVIINEVDNDKDDDRVDHDDDRYRPSYPSHSYPARGAWIPANCAIEVEGRDHREIVVYAESCLDRYGIDRLPHHCAREIKYKGRRDWVYGAACLRDAGFRLENTAHRTHERPD